MSKANDHLDNMHFLACAPAFSGWPRYVESWSKKSHFDMDKDKSFIDDHDLHAPNASILPFSCLQGSGVAASRLMWRSPLATRVEKHVGVLIGQRNTKADWEDAIS